MVHVASISTRWLHRGQFFFFIDSAQANETSIFSFITFTNLVVVQLNVLLAFPEREFPCFAKVNQTRKLFVITVLTLSMLKVSKVDCSPLGS